MSNKEKIYTLIDYVINTAECCPFGDEWEDNLEKECVGFGGAGCGECIFKNLDKYKRDC